MAEWNINTATKKIEVYMEDVNVPEFPQPRKQEIAVNLEDLGNSTDDQIGHMLAVYGAYRAYLEAQLAYVDSKKGLLESAFEEGLSKALYLIQSQKDKKVIKEVLRGEALATNPHLKQIRQDLIETEAMFARVRGLRDAYKAAFDTVSRAITIRTSNRNDV